MIPGLPRRQVPGEKQRRALSRYLGGSPALPCPAPASGQSKLALTRILVDGTSAILRGRRVLEPNSSLDSLAREYDATLWAVLIEPCQVLVENEFAGVVTEYDLDGMVVHDAIITLYAVVE